MRILIVSCFLLCISIIYGYALPMPTVIASNYKVISHMLVFTETITSQKCSLGQSVTLDYYQDGIKAGIGVGSITKVQPAKKGNISGILVIEINQIKLDNNKVYQGIDAARLISDTLQNSRFTKPFQQRIIDVSYSTTGITVSIDGGFGTKPILSAFGTLTLGGVMMATSPNLEDASDPQGTAGLLTMLASVPVGLIVNSIVKGNEASIEKGFDIGYINVMVQNTDSIQIQEVALNKNSL